MPLNDLTSFTAISFLSLVHLFTSRINFLKTHPHSPWLSASGGIGIAYVFGQTLPKLAKMNDVLMNATDTGIYGFLEHHAYLTALTGFIIYYGIDWLSFNCEQNLSDSCQWNNFSFSFILYLQAVCFIGYSFLIGYLITQIETVTSVILVTVAMGLHFVGIDYGLSHRYSKIYEYVIRWLLILGTYLGWAAGIFIQTAQTTIALWYAFLSGAIIINAVKDELPDETHGNFWAFLGGVCFYTGLIILIEYLT